MSKNFCVQLLSHVQLFVTPWHVQVPLSMEFSRQVYWSGLPFSSPGNLPHPGIESSFLDLAGGLYPGKPEQEHIA